MSANKHKKYFVKYNIQKKKKKTNTNFIGKILFKKLNNK